MVRRWWAGAIAVGMVALVACGNGGDGGSGGGEASGASSTTPASTTTAAGSTTAPSTAEPTPTTIGPGCDRTCRFPTFERSTSPLTTADGGNCDAALAAQYGGDCSNFQWMGLLGDPTVVHADGRYTMWFTAGERTSGPGEDPMWRSVIASATSDDGVHWSDPKDLDRDVVAQLAGGTPGLDPEGIETFDVVPVDTDAVDGDSRFVAYFTGDLAASPSSRHVIGRATSTDGVHWDKQPEPVLTADLPWERPFDAGGFEVGGVLEPAVIYDGGRWRMWYVGFGHDPERPDDPAYARIGYAESADGVTWAKRPDPVLVGEDEFEALGVSDPNVVADPRGGYHLFYVGIGMDERLRMGHAYSEDGLTWERNPANPIIAGVDGEFDAGLVGGPSALFVDGRLELFYMATTKPDFTEPVRFLRTIANEP